MVPTASRLRIATTNAPRRGGGILAGTVFRSTHRGRGQRAGLGCSAAGAKLEDVELLHIVLETKKPLGTSVAIGEVLDEACPNFANTVPAGETS